MRKNISTNIKGLMKKNREKFVDNHKKNYCIYITHIKYQRSFINSIFKEKN